MAKVSLNPEDYPPNPVRYLDGKPAEPRPKVNQEEKKDIPEKEVRQITTSAKRRKPTVGSKARELISGEDAKNVKDYICQDVLIPAAKDTVMDLAQTAGKMVMDSISMALFGTTKASSSRQRSSKPSYMTTDYTSMSRSKSASTRAQNERRERDRRPKRERIDEIILGTRGEAEEVLYEMYDFLRDYGTVTVADVYDMIGETTEYTDNKWGWTDLAGSRVRRVREGYLLEIPQPRPID